MCPTRSITAFTLVAVLAAPLQAQTIRGIVLDDSTSLPIAGAEVILRDTLQQTLRVEVTDRSVHFEMAPPAGKYSFEVLRMGYQPIYTDEFQVAAGSRDIDLTITLPNAPIMLDPAVVEGERQPFAPGPLEGFYERKRRGWGIQLDQEAIEAKAPVQVTDILRNLAGVRVVGMGGNKVTVEMVGQAPRIPPPNISGAGSGRSRFTADAGCPVQYWVDGVLYKPDPYYGINELLVSDIEAVEVYRRASETPAEFLSSDSRCGVVVIWTKRGP